MMTKKEKPCERILIISGTPVLSHELTPILISTGYSVAQAPHSLEALLMLHVLNPDIVLVDQTFADTLEAYHQIRSVLDAPVMLVGKAPEEELWIKPIPETITSQRKSCNDLINKISAFLKKEIKQVEDGSQS